MVNKYRTLHVGLGPIGLRIASASVKSGLCEPVAAADINPDLAGRTLGEVAEAEGVPDVEVIGDLAEAAALGRRTARLEE